MTNTELKALLTALHDKDTELRNRKRNREELAIETSPDALDQIQDSSRLREVRSALDRICAGVFGICVGCGESINPKRLGGNSLGFLLHRVPGSAPLQ